LTLIPPSPILPRLPPHGARGFQSYRDRPPGASARHGRKRWPTGVL